MIFIICVGITPLHTQCQFSPIEAVRALVENGADLDAMARTGLTAKDSCCRACRNDCADSCKLIQGISIILILDLFISSKIDMLISKV